MTGIAYVDSDRFLAAFPSALEGAAREAIGLVVPSDYPSKTVHHVVVDGEPLAIPCRQAHDEPDDRTIAGLSSDGQLALHCLFTRHTDGHVRQRHLRPILRSAEPWIVPFVVALSSEYVIEILEDIAVSLDDLEDQPDRRRSYAEFVSANPAFLRISEARIMSYWGAYHRRRFPSPRRKGTEDRYPGFRILDALEVAGK